MKNLIITTFITLFIIAVFGIVGQCDRTEQIIYNMPDDVYQAIKIDHPTFSDNQIADYYLKSKNDETK